MSRDQKAIKTVKFNNEIKKSELKMSEINKNAIKVCCTTCPKECVVTVFLEDGLLVNVEGQGCKRGEKFAQKEIITPERTLTSTVMVECGGKLLLLPVKTAAPIPKKEMALAMNTIRQTKLTGPCRMGDVVIPNVCGTGVDVVACRSIKENDHAC